MYLLIRTGLIIAVVLMGSVLSPHAATAACTHYASPSGGGNGLSQASPFQIVNFWSVASPGQTLCLLDGVYIGANSMVAPTIGLSGSSGNPITVSALNDGQVRINGEAARVPLDLFTNSWFVIEGINFHNSIDEAVCVIHVASHDVIIRRVICWDAPVNQNNHVWSIRGNGTRNVLIEDSAGFGKGRKILEWFGTSTTDNITVRRFWGQWSHSTFIGPKNTIQAIYNSYNFLGENIIATWDETPMGGAAVDQPTGLLSIDRQDAADQKVNARFFGSIAYIRSADEADILIGLGYGSSVNNITFKDVVSYLEPGTHANLRPFSTDATPDTPVSHNLTNTTEIGGTTSSVAADYTIANRIDVDTLVAAPNIWNGSGTQGARVCKQYVNGVLTVTPLWPWSMDARIRAALSIAGKNPDAIFGGTGNSVTQLMEQMFGLIPSECRTGTTLNAPTNLQVTIP